MKFLILIVTLLGQSEFKEEHWPTLASVTPSSTFQEEVWPGEEVKTPVKATEKETVEFVSATWCGNCRVPEAALTKSVVEKLPFKVKKVDADRSGYQGSVPAFRWKDSSGNSTGFVGWNSVEHLVREFKRTTLPKASRIAASASKTIVRRLSPFELRAIAGHYRGSSVGVKGGNFWAHLQDSNHGFSASQLQGLNQNECERIHSAHHNGQITPFTRGE